MTKKLLTALAILGLTLNVAQAATVVDTGILRTDNQVNDFFFNTTGTGEIKVFMDTLTNGLDADQVIWKKIPGDWELVAWSPGALRQPDSINSGLNIYDVQLKNGWVQGDVTQQGTSDPGRTVTVDAGEYRITTAGIGNFALGSQRPGGLLSQGFLGRGDWTTRAFYNGDHTYNTTVMGDFVTAVPVPAAVWLFGSALVGLGGFRRKTA